MKLKTSQNDQAKYKCTGYDCNVKVVVQFTWTTKVYTAKYWNFLLEIDFVKRLDKCWQKKTKILEQANPPWRLYSSMYLLWQDIFESQRESFLLWSSSLNAARRRVIAALYHHILSGLRFRNPQVGIYPSCFLYLSHCCMNRTRYAVYVS